VEQAGRHGLSREAIRQSYNAALRDLHRMGQARNLRAWLTDPA
jgi:DNA-directed RNA polymerase sigma subunit (sigma70/sigma32)